MHAYRHSLCPPPIGEPVPKVSLVTGVVRVQLFDQVWNIDVHIIVTMTEPSVGKMCGDSARVIPLQDPGVILLIQTNGTV